MPYRDFTLPDGRVVRTRVSDKATLEWYEEREVLKRKGYPDRPPDVDTETTRMWCGPNDPAMEQHMTSSFPIGHYVLNLGRGLPTIKVIVSALNPGDGYLLRVKMESGMSVTLGKNIGDFESMYPLGQEEALNYGIEHALKGLADLERFAKAIGTECEWLITTPGDVKDMEVEAEQAVEDYKQEYGDTELDHPYWRQFREPAAGSSTGKVH